MFGRAEQQRVSGGSMNQYRLRIPALSFQWLHVNADSEEEAFEQAVAQLEKLNPRVAWRDRSIWQIEKVEKKKDEEK